DGRRLPLALLSCCSTGWFDLADGEHCLAEALLFRECGPIGVVAGSRVTHPYGSILLQKEFSRLLLVERVKTLGELDLETTRRMLEVDELDQSLDQIAGSLAVSMGWHSSLEELRVMHVRLYNLLGDPALQLALPPEEGIELALDGDRLLGTASGMASGRATIRIETSRESLVGAGQLDQVDGPEDKALAKKAAHNYPLANERCLQQVETSITKGRFETNLRLPDAARVIKVLATGTGEDGAMVERVGSIRLTP
ncbi:MAG: C25 family cysteine peptidase, partial [Planctomycetota bacterium]